MIVAESVKAAPGIKTGSDYLFQARRILQQASFKYDYISQEFEKEMINGAEFYKMDAHLTYMGLAIQQRYYTTISKGFSFTVIVSYVTEEQQKVLLGAISSMKFKK